MHVFENTKMWDTVKSSHIYSKPKFVSHPIAIISKMIFFNLFIYLFIYLFIFIIIIIFFGGGGRGDKNAIFDQK